MVILSSGQEHVGNLLRSLSLTRALRGFGSLSSKRGETRNQYVVGGSNPKP